MIQPGSVSSDSSSFNFCLLLQDVITVFGRSSPLQCQFYETTVGVSVLLLLLLYVVKYSSTPISWFREKVNQRHVR